MREEMVERLEQEEEKQCSQQNVSQCYTMYRTDYRDSIRVECEEEFVKSCRIVMRERSYNHSVRVCKRPLVKDCDYDDYNNYGGYSAPRDEAQEPRLVCETLYETQCNTSREVRRHFYILRVFKKHHHHGLLLTVVQKKRLLFSEHHSWRTANNRQSVLKYWVFMTSFTSF